MKPGKRSVLYALCLLIYAGTIFYFLTAPAFENPIAIKKKETFIIVFIPFIALILALVLLFSDKLNALVETRIRDFSERYLAWFGVAVFVLAPTVIYTETFHEIHMCESIWQPAWIISLGAALVGTIILFLKTKREDTQKAMRVFICLTAFPMIYSVLVILCKLIAFNVDCYY